jgi:hypothetical protein
MYGAYTGFERFAGMKIFTAIADGTVIQRPLHVSRRVMARPIRYQARVGRGAHSATRVH